MKTVMVLLLATVLFLPDASFSADVALTGHYAIVPDTGQSCTKLKRPNESNSQMRFWEHWRPRDQESPYHYGDMVCAADDQLYRVVATKTTDNALNSKAWEKLGQSCARELPRVLGNGNGVQSQDGIVISALQANIADFKETALFGMQKKGEIALVVSARERTDNKRLFGDNAAKSGRVVFFQENVGAGTPLNLSNLSIYGPAIYNGYPLSLTFQFIEIDETERQLMRTLLPAVVNLSKTFTGANPVVTGFLDSIGNLLVASNKDDIVLEYHMEFDPPLLGSKSASPTLEFGTYVYLATQKPSDWVTWDAVYFNQRNGRLYSNNTCTTAIKNQSWISFQIKHSDPSRIIQDTEPTRLAEILAAQVSAHEDRNTALAKTIEVFSAERKTNLAFSKYLSVAQSVRGVAPAEFQANTKTALGEMLAEIDNHFTGAPSTSGVALSTPKVQRLLQELAQVQFSQDARVNADKALPFRYEGFSLAAAKASLEL